MKSIIPRDEDLTTAFYTIRVRFNNTKLPFQVWQPPLYISALDDWFIHIVDNKIVLYRIWEKNLMQADGVVKHDPLSGGPAISLDLCTK